MIPNNNFSVLPFYTDIRMQNHRKGYAFGNIYPLITPANFILPFQILVPYTKAPSFYDIQLMDKNGNKVSTITTAMKDTGLQFVPLTDYDCGVIIYPGDLPMAINAMDGIYYLQLYDNKNTYYSEMFTVVHDVSGCLKIEWWDVENMVTDAGIIVYDNPKFKNRLYLNTELGKPEYTFEEDGETRDGYFFPEKQISEKTYKCTALAPEYLCDVMRFIRMADYVVVTDKFGQTYNCDTFLITPKWQTQGDLASVEIEFETATVAKKIGRGYILTTKGDFNNDFNNDYLIN